jgi:hypothetical protein
MDTIILALAQATVYCKHNLKLYEGNEKELQIYYIEKINKLGKGLVKQQKALNGTN